MDYLDTVLSIDHVFMPIQFKSKILAVYTHTINISYFKLLQNRSMIFVILSVAFLLPLCKGDDMVQENLINEQFLIDAYKVKKFLEAAKVARSNASYRISDASAVGTLVGDIALWEVDSGKMALRPPLPWDTESLSPELLLAFEEASISVCRVRWNQDGTLFGVAYSKHIIQLYSCPGTGKIVRHKEFEPDTWCIVSRHLTIAATHLSCCSVFIFVPCFVQHLGFYSLKYVNLLKSYTRRSIFKKSYEYTSRSSMKSTPRFK